MIKAYHRFWLGYHTLAVENMLGYVPEVWESAPPAVQHHIKKIEHHRSRLDQ